MASLPTGAVEAVHDPEPADNVMVHNVVDPTVTTTDPMGVPLEELTVVEKVTVVPGVVGLGEALIVVVVARAATVRVVVPDDAEWKVSPE